MEESRPQRSALAFIGCVGIPNRYGGFESFAEHIATYLAANARKVLVTCQRSAYADDPSSHFKGVERVFINVPANGALSPLHDLAAFLSVAWRTDRILLLGVSAGIFMPFFRFLSAFCGAARIYVNIDGIEWRRTKFGPGKRLFLYASDRLAQWFSHGTIIDNPALSEFVVARNYVCVAYSGDHVRDGACETPSSPDKGSPYALTICRIEPENNCQMLIEGFLRSSLPKYYLIGNWNNSAYGRALRQAFAHEPRLELLDPIYDSARLDDLRSRCSIYLHGHSVGGTNPSLVEMLYYDSTILCFDCSFNRETATGAAEFFDSPERLAALLDSSSGIGAGDRETLREQYSAKAISGQLLRFLQIT